MDCFCRFFSLEYIGISLYSLCNIGKQQIFACGLAIVWNTNEKKKIATVQTITSRQKSTKHKLRAVFFTNRTCKVFVLFAGVAVNQCTFCIIIFTPVFFFFSLLFQYYLACFIVVWTLHIYSHMLISIQYTIRHSPKPANATQILFDSQIDRSWLQVIQMPHTKYCCAGRCIVCCCSICCVL